MSLALRFALRELRGGVRGFRIFLACLALGVAAIAAAGSTAEAFRQGLAGQAREILGGDIAISSEGGPLPVEDLRALEKFGRMSVTVGGRLMAQAPSGERRLVELRGVDPSYPLVGRVTLEGGGALAPMLATRDGLAGAVVERELLEKLRLRIGDTLLVGETPLQVRGVLIGEPDRLSRGFALGPRVMTRLDVVEASGVLKGGPPFDGAARLLVSGDSLSAEVAKVRSAVADKAYRVRDRQDAAPGLRWLIDQLEYFLAFIGLASLIAGGLGVYGAVSAYLEGRRPAIAVLKVMGATGGLVRNIYLIQIAVLSAVGIAIGLAVGAAAPVVLGKLFEGQLPVPALFAIYPEPLLRAAAFGALAAMAFSLPPLARARRTQPSSLLRRNLTRGGVMSLEMLTALVAAAGLAGLALVTAPDLLAAVILIVGVVAAFVILWLIGLAIASLAGRARGLTRGPLRLAIANLSGPHSAARTAAPAIGLGVALLATVVLIQSSLLSQVTDIAPRSAPALVFTDIPGDQVQAFDATLSRAFGAPLTQDGYLRTPFLTGRIVALNGTPVARQAIAQRERWAFDNDISMSAIAEAPINAGIVTGRWWAGDYAGPPLIALEADAAAAAGLKVGDRVTLSVLGRELETRIAVLRQVDLGGFGASFPVVINPSALAGANLQHVAIAKASRAQEAAASRALGRQFPDVNVISVRDQLEAASDIFSQLALAVRGAASVAALAGLLVLIGAIAARAQGRAREAATLKVLGATRPQILAAYMTEYGVIGAIAGLAGLTLGYAAAWPVVVEVFRATWSVDWRGVGALVGGTTLVATLGGAAAAAWALSDRPAQALRTL